MGLREPGVCGAGRGGELSTRADCQQVCSQAGCCGSCVRRRGKAGFRSAAGSGPGCSSLALDSPASSLSPDPGQTGLVFPVPGGCTEPPAPAGKGKRGRRRAWGSELELLFSLGFSLCYRCRIGFSLPSRFVHKTHTSSSSSSLSFLLLSELSWHGGLSASGAGPESRLTAFDLSPAAGLRVLLQAALSGRRLLTGPEAHGELGAGAAQPAGLPAQPAGGPVRGRRDQYGPGTGGGPWVSPFTREAGGGGRRASGREVLVFPCSPHAV